VGFPDREQVDYEDGEDMFDNVPEEGEELPPKSLAAQGDQHPIGSILA